VILPDGRAARMTQQPRSAHRGCEASAAIDRRAPSLYPHAALGRVRVAVQRAARGTRLCLRVNGTET
jgi:hypothetical protein